MRRPDNVPGRLYFFRTLKGFVAQFGIHGDPKALEFICSPAITLPFQVSAEWRGRAIQDDPSIGQHNTLGTIAFAAAGTKSDYYAD